MGRPHARPRLARRRLLLTVGDHDLGFVAGDSATADAHDHAFLWWNGWRADLTPDARSYVRVAGLSLRDEVAGNYGDGAAQRSFVWSAGSFTQLPDLGGTVEVYDINDAGVIVGRAADGNRMSAAMWVPGPCNAVRMAACAHGSSD